MEKIKYTFEVKNPQAIDFRDLVSDLSRKNPVLLARTTRGTQEVRFFIHDSLVIKMTALGHILKYKDCEEFHIYGNPAFNIGYNNIACVTVSQENIRPFINFLRNVKHSSWPETGSSVKVEVTSINLNWEKV